jgi:hypothetical protein
MPANTTELEKRLWGRAADELRANSKLKSSEYSVPVLGLIRAVLIETTDELRARKLMELAQLPAVLGGGKRSSLFWFVISPLFTAPNAIGNSRQLSTYLWKPDIVLDRLWALPDLTLHALGDTDNSAL